LKPYGDIGGKIMWYSCASTHSTCLTRSAICALRRFVLEPATKSNHAEASVLCKVLWK